MLNNNIFNFNQSVFDEIIKKEVERLVRLQMDDFKRDLSTNYFFDDRLLGREEVAIKLDISIGTLDNIRKKGKLKGCAIGKSVKFRNSEVLAYIKSLKPC
jgi:predicted DNA-binding transcriptional regulator AlpA